MTKKFHKCDESCKHPPKRKMGTTKKKVKKEVVIKTVQDEIYTKLDSVSTDNTTHIGSALEGEYIQTWHNITAATCGIPSGITKNEKLKEIEELFNSIILSNNESAREEAKYTIEECQRKLFNLKKDKEIA